MQDTVLVLFSLFVPNGLVKCRIGNSMSILMIPIILTGITKLIFIMTTLYSIDYYCYYHTLMLVTSILRIGTPQCDAIIYEKKINDIRFAKGRDWNIFYHTLVYLT